MPIVPGSPPWIDIAPPWHLRCLDKKMIYDKYKLDLKYNVWKIQ